MILSWELDCEVFGAPSVAVLLPYREEYYRPETERSGVADVIVAKNRTGPTGAVELAFLKSFTRFESMAGERRGSAYPRIHAR